jgi:hypothetical protein
LIELLLVIAIVTVLSTMALGVLRSATTDAKISATQARLTQINAIMEVVMEDYSVRRMPIDLRDAHLALNPSEDFTRALMRSYRNRVIAELVDVELPRPYYFEDYDYEDDDIREGMAFYEPYSNRVGELQFFDGPGYVGEDPQEPKSQAPFDLIGDWRNSGSILGALDDLPDNQFPPVPRSAKMQRWEVLRTAYGNKLDLPGEYLYQFLYSYDFDGTPAVEALGSQAIADTDGDNLMEVVDAFGEPLLYEIQQLRSPDDAFVDSANPHDVDLDSIPDTRDERGAYVAIFKNGFTPSIGDIRIVAFSSRSTQDLTHYPNN